VARAGGTLVASAGRSPGEASAQSCRYFNSALPKSRPRRGPRTLRRWSRALSLIGLALLTVSAVPGLGCGKYGPPRRSPPVARAGSGAGADSGQAVAEAEAARQELERENERAKELREE
jgi:hypothetical protein